MKSREKKWCVWIAVVSVLSLALPFGPLKDNRSLYGAFAFWLIMSVTVIISGAIYTRNWGKSRGDA